LDRRAQMDLDPPLPPQIDEGVAALSSAYLPISYSVHCWFHSLN
jgi:hypothetical protein